MELQIDGAHQEALKAVQRKNKDRKSWERSAC